MGRIAAKQLTIVEADSALGTEMSVSSPHVMHRPLFSFRMPEPRAIIALIDAGHPILGFILALAWIVVPSTIILLAVMRVTHGL
ncbi:MAG: hypothetical protein WC804_17725 [Sphingomonas sp.]|jgi:hypothetical protein|uniref:hypothetical protein n=1 Tax=Sphingomonas sp. TaxID=28214 RepID=UPI00356B0906